MAGFTVGNTNIFTSNTFSATFNGLTVNNQLVFEDTGSHFQGETFGFTAGGESPGADNIIDKFPFATDTNASDAGDLSVSNRYGGASASSETDGYVLGGLSPAASPIYTGIGIDKFPFAISGGTATDIGDLTAGAYAIGGGNSSTISGYRTGGVNDSGTSLDIIDKVSFSTDGNATDVGNLSVGRDRQGSATSSTDGYAVSGRNNGPPARLMSGIDKFPFATDTNASGVGSITITKSNGVGQSSETDGYSSGGSSPLAISDIEKFSFSNELSVAIIGDLTQARSGGAGQSSTVSGYTSGGSVPNAPSPGITTQNTIDKFPFSADTNATDVGDLTAIRYETTGHQV